jgi:hypothetical protein
MSYYTFTPRQVYPAAGFGALGGIEFNGAAVWSDWVACDNAYKASVAAGTPFSGHPSCKRAVDAIRAALGQLGYGKLGMGVAWGSADQGAWKDWAAKAGVAPSGGMPTKDGLAVMDAQIAKGVKTGDKAAVDYTLVDGNYVETSQLTDGTAKAGIDWSTWGLVALGVAGVGAVAIVASKKKGRRSSSAPARVRPSSMTGSPSMAAARR